jgi:prepilin-type N-terminal cleavage/methylation domain-containing protein
VKTRNGFTLIELLVVIAIIAILAAILFPVFAAARASARQTACMSSINQMGKAMKSYTSEWGGWFPPSVGAVGWLADNDPAERGWPQKLANYSGNDQNLFVCAETRATGVDTDGKTKLMCSYVMSVMLLGSANVVKVPAADIANPSKTIAIYETNESARNTRDDTYCFDWDPSNEAQGLDSISTEESKIPNNDTTSYWQLLKFPGPHKGTELILFADAHVKGSKKWAPSQMTFFPNKTDF